MRILILATTLMFSFASEAMSLFDTKVISLSSDKSTYAVGESAVLRAQLYSRPNNPNFDFDVVATLNGTPIAVDRVTDFELFSTAKDLAAGTYVWEATVVLQDARYARDLKEAIAYYADEIERIDEQLVTETDPQAIENLENRKARAEALKAASESELASIRTPVLAAPQTLEFQVQ